MSTTIEGRRDATGMRFAIAAGRFNELIVTSLVDGATRAVGAHGGDVAVVAWCPGAVELPLLAKKLADSGRFDAVIALGCVIRGGTPHFEYVAGMAANGLARVSADSGIPVSFGVLTTESIEQALERAGTKMGNKGADAAIAAIEMVDVLRRVATELS